jgi:hypothetical protein
MRKELLISADLFCSSHQIEVSFIHSLYESGLIEIVVREEEKYIPSSQLQRLEKMIRLYYEMNINLEGIETINHLLQSINNQQQEISKLKNRLRWYE